ncbi:uncharacterized protein Dmoj_GI26181 [Drosophila mojavensis]|uniref:Uncharacterized protein n=1 Tax=Drosophila mojavensis TaxID=7230 RepID=A0A0Q9X3M6_DROMO|nr:uncharacterized protein Dmoj_GI26181 [Drosophila mojavensis]
MSFSRSLKPGLEGCECGKSTLILSLQFVYRAISSYMARRIDSHSDSDSYLILSVAD